MIKKIVAISLTLILAFAVTACGSGGSSGSGDTVKFIVGTGTSENSNTAKALKEMEANIEELSEGTVDVEVYYSETLGSESEMIEQLAMGSVNLVLPGSTLLSAYDERFGIWDIPFLFTSYEAIDEALAGELGEEWDSWMEEYDFHSFGIIPTGFRGLSNSKHAVHTPADMKGLKIRVMESDAYIDTFNALGANTVTMNYSDVYSGLQQGVIDGQDNPAEFTVTSAFYEIQDYYTELNHVMCMMPVFTSTDYYDGLSDQQRAAIDEGVATMIENLTAEFRANEDGFLKQMADSGVEITELTDDEMQQFVDKVGSVHNSFKKSLGKDLFNICMSYNE